LRSFFLEKGAKENLKSNENILFPTSLYPLLQAKRGRIINISKDKKII